MTIILFIMFAASNRGIGFNFRAPVRFWQQMYPGTFFKHAGILLFDFSLNKIKLTNIYLFRNREFTTHYRHSEYSII